MDQERKNQWIRGPKPRKNVEAGWRETEAMMKSKAINPNSSSQQKHFSDKTDSQKELNTQINPNIQSAVMGIIKPMLPEKEKSLFPVRLPQAAKKVSSTYEDEKKPVPQIFPDTSIQSMKKISQINPSKTLSFDTDDITKTYVQETTLERIKSRIPAEDFSNTFEYYEGEIIETEEEKPEPLIVTRPTSPVREYLKKMIVYSPGPELNELMMLELEPLGEVLLGECQEFGIGIIIYERYRNLTEIRIDNEFPFPPGTRVRDGRGWETVRGAYNPQHRMMFMAEELISGRPGGVSTHEFAHAYDHAWMVNNEMQFGFSVFLWNQFYNERIFITEYAATQPKEYFAVSMESYFNPHRKELLKKCDPRMYGFIGNLIAGVHKRPKKALSD